MSESEDIDGLIARLVSATDKEEKLAVYKKWADRYDHDLERKGYVAPEKAAQLLFTFQPDTSSKVYDAGCGTGRAGSCLEKLGYTYITGEDFSEAMLDIASLSGHYQSLNTADYTQAIEHADNSFDASVCVGVYSQEFKNIFLDELVRIVKPGGHIVLSCRPIHFENGAQAEIDRLITNGRITLESLSRELYMLEHNSTAWFAVMKVS